MHYKFLSEIGDHYSSEEGTEGVREAALTQLETRLNEAVVNLSALYSAMTAQLPGTSSSDYTIDSNGRPNVFAGQLSATNNWQNTVDNGLNSKILSQKAEVENFKRWLTLQGAEIKEVGGQFKIDWDLSRRTVVYDRNLSAQDLTQVRFNGGRLYTDGGFTKPLDTTDMVTYISGPGFAIYVMSEEGSLHIDSHSVGNRHHSSLLAGQNVGGAGEVMVKQGNLVWISNKSGHYHPSAPHFLQVLHQLQKKNVDLSVVKVKYFAKPPTPAVDYASVGLYLANTEAQGIDSYDFAKLVRYIVKIPFPEFVTLARAKGWRWVNKMEMAMGKRGVVTIVGGTPVAHKVVRQWLKSIGKAVDAEIQSGKNR